MIKQTSTYSYYTNKVSSTKKLKKKLLITKESDTTDTDMKDSEDFFVIVHTHGCIRLNIFNITLMGIEH